MEVMSIGYAISLSVWIAYEIYADFNKWKNDYYRDKDLLMRKESLKIKFYRWIKRAVYINA